MKEYGPLEGIGLVYVDQIWIGRQIIDIERPISKILKLSRDLFVVKGVV